MKDRILKTAAALEKNNMKTYIVKDKEEALKTVEMLIPKGATIGLGGSVTLNEIGVNELVSGADYKLFNRYDKNLTPDERNEKMRKSLTADVFLSSSNAVTEKGELVNVDGNSNRVAAILYGPKEVIIVVGANKIVADVNEGIKRVKTIAAPKNTKRLSCETYCNKTGICMGVNGDLCDGCASESRICCNYVISAHQRFKDRIKVIICEEELGY